MKKRWMDLLLVLLALAALPLLVAVALGVYFARLMVDPPRRKQWKTPQDEGVAYDNVHFEAQDGVPISAWFIPALETEEGSRPTVIMVHGWTWNRLGLTPEDPLSRITGAPGIDLLQPALALHRTGYHVLMLDLRNHGRSGASPTVTFGHDEAKDVLGAIDYVQKIEDVDADRIGLLGYSMGANAVIFACSETEAVKAAIAVQPVRPTPFAHRLAGSLLGPLSGIALDMARRLYYRAGGPLWEVVDPAIVADLVKADTMYVQGNGDPWGDVQNVRRLCEAGREVNVLEIVPSADRYGGYLYLGEHPDKMLAFFREHLSR